MTRPGRRNILSEIVDRKTRSGGDRDIWSSYFVQDLLRRLAAADEKHRADLKEFVIVRCVTTIEVFFRSCVALLVDEQDEVARRAGEFTSGLKFDVDLILALKGQSLTIGDIVSHMVYINKIDDINKFMSVLLNYDFLDALKSRSDRWEVEIERKPESPILDEPARIYASVSQLFEARHILIHELPRRDQSPVLHVEQWLDDVEKFLRASTWLVSETVHPGAPLQQQSMNEEAGGRLATLLERMEALHKTASSLLDQEGLDLLQQAQDHWDKHLRADMRLWGDGARGGSLSPLLAAERGVELAEQRNRDLEEFIERHAQV